MDHKERFYSAIGFKGVDRLPVRYEGNPGIDRDLMNYFNVDTFDKVLDILGNDFASAEPVYKGPELKLYEDGSWDGIWGEKYKYISFGPGAYPETVYLPFADMSDISDLKSYRFPTPDWYDYSTIREQCENKRDYVTKIFHAGVPDFINGIARCRGVEQVLLDIATEDPVYMYLMEYRLEFFLEVVKRTLKAGNGMIDVLHIGEDLGTQNGPLMSNEKFDRIFAPRLKKFIELGHSYGAKVMMHSCGSVRHLIPRLIDMGLDILDVVQVDAYKMNIEELHKEFYGRITFAGSMSTQSTLAFGTVEDVKREVELRKRLFKEGGMIVAPSNQIQDGTPVDMVIAMYETVGSLRQQR